MTYLITEAAPAQIAPLFGAVGLMSQLAWPLFKQRRTILLIQLTGAASYGACYAALGQQTGAAVCLTGATQTLIALMAGNRPWLARMGYVFLPIVLALGVLTWSGLPTLLAVSACCLVMLGRMQADTLRMRSVQITAAPFGAAHDIVTGAWTCLPGAVVSFTIAATALRRELRRRREDGVRTGPALAAAT